MGTMLMRNGPLAVCLFPLLCAAGFAQQTLTLDETLNRAGTEIGNGIDRGTIVAVLNFQSPSEELSAYIINGLTASLLRTGNPRVVSRQRVEEIFSELHFQASGLVSDETARSMGRMTGAQAVITGTITRLGNVYRLNVQCLEVETALILRTLDFDIRRDARMTAFEDPGTVQARASRANRDDRDSGTGGLFADYTPFTTLTQIGYNFEEYGPLGFTVGFAGFYTTWNFPPPNDTGDYDVIPANATGISSTWNWPMRYGTGGILGYSFNVIPGILYFPIGFGFHHGFQYSGYSWSEGDWSAGTGISRNETLRTEKETLFVAEMGALAKFGRLPFYFSASYRLLFANTFEETFSLGAGFAYDFGRFDRFFRRRN